MQLTIDVQVHQLCEWPVDICYNITKHGILYKIPSCINKAGDLGVVKQKAIGSVVMYSGWYVIFYVGIHAVVASIVVDGAAIDSKLSGEVNSRIVKVGTGHPLQAVCVIEEN